MVTSLCSTIFSAPDCDSPGASGCRARWRWAECSSPLRQPFGQPAGSRGWWLALVGWAFVWPHLARQIASRASDPLHREFSNFKIDAIFAGVWIGLTGVNALPSCALLMMMGMNLMGAGGSRLFFAGTVLMTLSTLLTLQLTGGVVSFSSTPLEGGLTLPIIILYPLLFARVSYQTATTLAEHKRRLKIMSTHDGMTGVFNRRHWEMLLRAEFERCRRQHCDCTLPDH